jgi:hypothetical protein
MSTEQMRNGEQAVRFETLKRGACTGLEFDDMENEGPNTRENITSGYFLLF